MNGFPQDVEVVARKGGAATKLADIPTREGTTLTGVEPGPRSHHWRADQPAADAHGMVPEQAIRFARMLGDKLPPLRIIGCEPAAFDSGADGTFRLSEPVQAAVEPAIELVRSLIAEVLGTAEVETTGLSCMSWE